MALCSLIEADLYLRGAYCLHHLSDFFKSTQYHIPQDCYVHSCCHETLKSQNIYIFSDTKIMFFLLWKSKVHYEHVTKRSV